MLLIFKPAVIFVVVLGTWLSLRDIRFYSDYQFSAIDACARLESISIDQYQWNGSGTRGESRPILAVKYVFQSEGKNVIGTRLRVDGNFIRSKDANQIINELRGASCIPIRYPQGRPDEALIYWPTSLLRESSMWFLGLGGLTLLILWEWGKISNRPRDSAAP